VASRCGKRSKLDRAGHAGALEKRVVDTPRDQRPQVGMARRGPGRVAVPGPPRTLRQ